jgi:Ca2+-binding EF-hand superfamily protein
MQEDFKLAFRAIDTDNDNLISFTDLRNFLELANEKRSEE